MAESESGRPGADFLHLDASAVPSRGLTTWLVGELRSAVADGRLRPGTALPATRALASDLGVSRGVVVEAYRRLGDEGLLSGRTRAGTTVTTRAVRSAAAGSAAGGSVAGGSAAATASDSGPPPTMLVAHAADPVELDLWPGRPDLSAFPRAAWLAAERAVLADTPAGDLGYGDPRGHPRLRGELAGWLARTRGVRADAGDVLVVAGVAQALALLAQVLRARGATSIAVEDPGSRGARDELAHWGLRPVGVAVDDHGVDVAELSATGAPVAMLTPAHQFPTGVVLAPQRRRELLDWASAGGLVVEDDYDAEHRYDRPPVPALQASLPERVAHAGSTSKSLAPGLRLGWLVAPAHLRADLVAARYASDLGSPALSQLTLAHLLAGGQYDRHLRLVRRRQRARRDAILDALGEHLPQARVAGVAAGLHLLVTLPELTGSVDDVELAGRAAGSGVRVQPLSWHRERPGPPGLVLGYAALAPDRLREAVRRLAAHVPAVP